MARSNTSMNIVLGVVNTGLVKGLNVASAKIGRFAANMKAVGSKMTASFTMPLALIGGAGVKMAMDFEKSMTKIQTLVLGSAQDMEQYELEVAKAFDRGYKKGLRDGKEEGVKAIEELMKTYNKNMGKFEESLTKIIKGE